MPPHRVESFSLSEAPIFDWNDLVTVLVGKDEIEYTIHKGTLQYHSPVFKVMCSERWLWVDQSTRGVIRLPDDHPDVFRMFMLWTQSSKLFYDPGEVLWSHGMDINGPLFGHAVLVMLAVFCDKYDIKPLLRLTLETLVERREDRGPDYPMSLIPLGVTKLVYENTMTKSPLRYWLLIRFLSFSSKPWVVQSFQGSFSGEFIWEFLAMTTRLRAEGKHWADLEPKSVDEFMSRPEMKI